MDGRDMDAVLICCGDGEFRRACCWAMRASRRAAASERALGELPPNREVNLLPLVKEARRGSSRFSFRESVEIGVDVAKGLIDLAGIAAFPGQTEGEVCGLWLQTCVVCVGQWAAGVQACWRR